MSKCLTPEVTIFSYMDVFMEKESMELCVEFKYIEKGEEKLVANGNESHLHCLYLSLST